MKLASLPKGRDGELIVVDRDLERAVKASEIAPTMQFAIENWDKTEPLLQKVYEDLNAGKVSDSFAFEESEVAAPFPRMVQFLDGSAYLPHVERVRRARGAEMPPSFKDDPLMYQGVSDGFLAPTENIRMESEEWGIDFESEVGVILNDTPMGIKTAEAEKHIKLLCLINDVSLRNLIPNELGKGFGFLQSKPRSALSPVVVTPDELGNCWRDGKVDMPLRTHYNGELFGYPECGIDMQFSFSRLVEHAAKSRPLSAGTLIGSGTIANQDEAKGSSCLAEKRMLEIIKHGKASTPFMAFGDRVHIEMHNEKSHSVFGAIEQLVEQYKP